MQHEPIIDQATFDKAQERLRKLAQQAANRKKPTRSVFSGLIHCGLCGNTYKRVTYRKKHYWNCTTFQTKGKSECAAKRIPEETLETLTCEVLGEGSIDSDMFRSKITAIRAEKSKCFTVDFLTKKRKVNEGEVPQYYVEHSHEPIITPEEFDKVQTELARRKRISRQYSGKSIFSSRIVCGDCGSYFGSKVWNSTSKYRRVIWQCNSKFKGEHKCETPHLDEETIKARFVTALNAIIESKDNILEDCRLMQATLTDCTGIDTEIESLLEEIDVVTELTKRCIAENSQMAQNQEEYAARYNGFVERYEKAKAQLEQLRATKAAREAQAEAIGAFMFEVQELDTLSEFDEKLWLTVIDTVTVHADGRMIFKFQGGTEIEA